MMPTSSTTANFFNRSYGSLTHKIPSVSPSIRIGITGSQGVGKTTLAQALATELNIPFIEEMARVVQPLGFPLGLETTLYAQIAMWFAQFATENSLSSYVADRMLFDVITHSELLAGRNNHPQERLLINVMGQATAQILAQHYHLIFYIPIEYPLVGDGVRDTSLTFQKALDQKTVELLHTFQIPFFEIRGSVEERLEQSLIIINQQLNYQVSRHETQFI